MSAISVGGVLLRSPPPGPFDVFLIAGDSNAVGGGEGFDAVLDAPNPKIFQWRGSGTGVVLQASECLLAPEKTTPDQNVGFGMSFAKAYLAAGRLTSGAQGVLLISAGVGGSAFANNWNGTRVGYFGLWAVAVANYCVQAKNLANAALATHASNVFKGVLWNEGVNDLGTIVNAPAGSQAVTDAYNNYAVELDALIDYFRANITGATSAPIILGPGMTNSSKAHFDTVDELYATNLLAKITATPSRKTNCAVFAGAAGSVNENISGNVHWNGLGQRINGQNAYTAYATIA